MCSKGLFLVVHGLSFNLSFFIETIVLNLFKLSSLLIPTKCPHIELLCFLEYHFSNSGTNSSNSIAYLKNGNILLSSFIANSGISRTHLSFFDFSQQIHRGSNTETAFLKDKGKHTQ